MDYDLFETYIVLCETRNITKTAELLYKTQPAISSRIQQLEEYFGFTLIHRTKGKKTITLTAKGEEFLEIARKFISLYGEIESKKERINNSLVVSSIDSLSASAASDICYQLIEEYHTHITLLTYQTPDAYRMIANKQLDIAFVSYADQMNGVLCEPVFQLDYIVIKPCASPGPVASISFEELDASKEIYQRWNTDFENWHHQHFGNDNYMVRVDSCATLKRFLNYPDCWAIIQTCNLDEVSDGMSLQVYELIDPPPIITCYMLTSAYPDRINFDIVNKFRQMAHQYAQNHLLV